MDIRKWKKDQKKVGKKQKGQRQKTKMKPYEKQQEKRRETYVFRALDTRKKNGDVRGEDGMGSFVLVRFDSIDMIECCLTRMRMKMEKELELETEKRIGTRTRTFKIDIRE